MSDRSHPVTLSRVVLALTLVFFCRTASFAQSEAIRWYAELYEENPDYIVAYVDIHALPTNQYLTNVSFDVAIQGQGESVSTETFRFTDSSLARLASGVVHRKYFRHSSGPARTARGRILRYMVGVEGAILKSALSSRKSSPRFSISDTRLVGQRPSAAGRTRFSLTDWLGEYDFFDDGLGPITLKLAATEGRLRQTGLVCDNRGHYRRQGQHTVPPDSERE